MKRFSIIVHLSKRILIGLILVATVTSLVIIYTLTQRLEILSLELKSTRYDATYELTNKDFLNQLQKTLDESEQVRFDDKKAIEKPKFLLIVTRRLGQREYLLNNSGQLFKDDKVIELDQKSRRELNKAIAKIEELSPYGELISWDKAQALFPKYAKATIRDIETGLAFRVQNRAGSKHADFQPLTKEDTAIFKTIYGGGWSWRRRAVVVEIDGKKIAASMNGMPHGSGAISGNDFRGHSCLHFLNSRVHGSNKIDLAHQIMIWKSAGKFEEYLESHPPEKLPEILVTVFDQLDDTILRLLIKNNDLEKELLSFMQEIERAKLEALKLASNEKSQKTFQGKLKIIDKNQKEVAREFEIIVVKNEGLKGWYIASFKIINKTK